MKNFLLFALLPLLCDADVDVIGQHVYIQQELTWIEAQKYCRENYVELSAITSEEEHRKLVKNLDTGWIGLHRAAALPLSWKWSDGRPTNFTKWVSGQLDDPVSREACVRVDSNGWYDEDCSGKRDFYCQEKIIFVKENKTWDEALEYCSSKYIGLLSLNSETRLNLAAVVNQPVSVWTGLRFLDGKWIWLNGAQAGSLVSLPSCPVQTYRCGARNFNKSVWENRDCNEKLYFLCY